MILHDVALYANTIGFMCVIGYFIYHKTRDVYNYIQHMHQQYNTMCDDIHAIKQGMQVITPLINSHSESSQFFGGMTAYSTYIKLLLSIFKDIDIMSIYRKLFDPAPTQKHVSTNPSNIAHTECKCHSECDDEDEECDDEEDEESDDEDCEDGDTTYICPDCSHAQPNDYGDTAYICPDCSRARLTKINDYLSNKHKNTTDSSQPKSDAPSKNIPIQTIIDDINITSLVTDMLSKINETHTDTSVNKPVDSSQNESKPSPPKEDLPKTDSPQVVPDVDHPHVDNQKE